MNRLKLQWNKWIVAIVLLAASWAVFIISQCFEYYQRAGGRYLQKSLAALAICAVILLFSIGIVFAIKRFSR
jgi:hypothetical protein